MKPLDTVRGPALSLPDTDVDTDIVYPARFLLITEKKGLGAYAFHDRRGEADFPIGDGPVPPILIAGANFGCGSSREQAPWALADLGIRLIVAESFGEIFFTNCFRNGLLPIRLDAATVDALHAAARDDAEFEIDLRTRTLSVAGREIAFDVADDRREALLNGWDDTARIRALHGDDIARFEAAQRRDAPWLWTKD